MNPVEFNDVIDVETISFEHNDTGTGFFREILRLNEVGRVQVSHSRVVGGVFKGFHGHQKQVQATLFLNGKLKIELIPVLKLEKGNRYAPHISKNKRSFEIDADQQASGYIMGPYWVHGYTVLSDYTDVIYVNSDFYDLSQEIRVLRENLIK